MIFQPTAEHEVQGKDNLLIGKFRWGLLSETVFCRCFTLSHRRAVDDLNIFFFLLVFICSLIVSFPFQWAPILSRNKNLTLMRERGFDFHFPLRVWHIFFIFLLVQLIISVWRVCDTIPCTANRARGEPGGKPVCTTSMFTQLSRSGLLPKKNLIESPQIVYWLSAGFTSCPRCTLNSSFFI